MGMSRGCNGKGISQHDVPESERSNYAIICRGATSGRWGKSAVIRAIKIC
jgi:hypothetical protein